MNRNFIKFIFISLMVCPLWVSAQSPVEISGTEVEIVQVPANTGLKCVYVAENTLNATITYRSSSSSVEWQRFSSLGGGFAEPIQTVSHTGDTYTILADTDDMGYIITDGGMSLAFWVVNYINHPWTITAIAPAESDCSRVWLNVAGSAPEIHYYTVNGRREILPRDIKIEYNTLSYDSQSRTYIETRTSETFSGIEGSVNVQAPFCDTDFRLFPDSYSERWSHAIDIQSPVFTTGAIALQTTADQSEREADNEQKVESESLGGSAPCEIAFAAAVTDAAIYHRWEVASTPDFADTYLTYDQLDFTYTFTEAGSAYIRFVANNAAGSCEQISETYTVSIGESKLDCPNAFSPGTSEGVNDEWKVSYKSIVSFDCQIFNSWGKKLATLTDPSQGWDGKVGGKVVGPGVYYYVIKARGADGKEYKLSGDINVISSRRNSMKGTMTE